MSSSKSTSGSPTAPPTKRQKTSSSSSSSSTAAAPIFSTTRNINKVPVEVWKEHICQKFLNLKELSILRRSHTFFEKYWQNVMAQSVIRVPQGCSTVEKAMALAVIFSERKEYTKVDPLKIRLDEGVHEIVGTCNNSKTMKVTCSHITFVGKGKDQTTVRGGFEVENQQNVKFEELIVTNGTGGGFFFHGSETNVDVLKCVVKECVADGAMWVGYGATVTATQCEFMENGSGAGVWCECEGANTKARGTKVRLNDCQMHHNEDGLSAFDYEVDHEAGAPVVDLHGTKTAIHSNTGRGIYASGGKVNIHLPSQHNTSHDNVGEDRRQRWGGSIANINADGTFTHVVVPHEEEDDY
jgi:hypothetical protein